MRTTGNQNNSYIFAVYMDLDPDLWLCHILSLVANASRSLYLVTGNTVVYWAIVCVELKL